MSEEVSEWSYVHEILYAHKSKYSHHLHVNKYKHGNETKIGDNIWWLQEPVCVLQESMHRNWLLNDISSDVLFFSLTVCINTPEEDKNS
jgi:hypothetical protein